MMVLLHRPDFSCFAGGTDMLLAATAIAIAAADGLVANLALAVGP